MDSTDPDVTVEYPIPPPSTPVGQAASPPHPGEPDGQILNMQPTYQ